MLKLGNRVTVKPLKSIRQDHPLGHCSGLRGEVVQIGDGPHVQPTNPDVVKLHKEASATCPDPLRPILVDSQWVNGNPSGVTGMREWFTEEELELG